MLKLGEEQILKVVRKVDFGAYLAEGNSRDEERVLLPFKQVPEEAKVGDEIKVFLYKDSEDRLIATTSEPNLKFNEVKLLTVASVNKIGAFLEWGLLNDLFLPYQEQTMKVEAGDKV